MGDSDRSVYFVVSLAVIDGGMAEFERIALEMIETTRLEPGCVAYEWYLDRDRKQCRLLEHYANPAAVLRHIQGHAVQTHVPRMLQSSTITNFEVYGDPGEEAATVLQGVGAKLFAPWHLLRS